MFWPTTIISGFIYGDYNHATRLVSELGALGTRSQYLFMTGFILTAILSVLFVVGLYKTCRRTGLHSFPVFIILTFSFSILGAALFPLPMPLHGILGMPSVLLFLSPLLGFLLWPDKKVSGIKMASLVAFSVMSLGFLIFLPNVLSEYPGLKQRFFHAGWTIWFVYLSYRFIGVNEMMRKEKPNRQFPKEEDEDGSCKNMIEILNN
jgi:hypothetical membrane protein